MSEYEYEYESEESSEEELPICKSCYKPSTSINYLDKICVHCEMIKDDELVPRLSDLPLYELENVECRGNGKMYWRNKRIV